MVQPHRKVQVVVARAPEAILFLQTNAKRGGFWQNVTGSVEHGEDWHHAAARELREETGLLIDPDTIIDLNLTWHFHDRWQRDVEERAYLAIVADQAIILSDEHQAFAWHLTINDTILQQIKFPSNRDAITAALKKMRAT